jgi:hypothetical protein
MCALTSHLIIIFFILYSGKFSHGANFHIFRMVHPLCQNKKYENLNMRNFFLVCMTLDLCHTQSLALLQVLTISLYQFFANGSSPNTFVASHYRFNLNDAMSHLAHGKQLGVSVTSATSCACAQSPTARIQI